MYKHIINLFPPHHTYVEPFGGAAWVLLNKQPSPVEIYNDLDGQVVNLFRVLRDNGDELIEQLQLTPYARGEFVACLDDHCDDPIEAARRAFVCFRQGFNAKGNSPGTWSYNISLSRRGRACSVSHWLSIIDSLPEIITRLKRVQIECLDALDIIPRYDTEETLFYCDPPYPAETRVDAKSYQHEMTIEQHAALLDLLKQIQGMVVLSGAHCPLYDETLVSWECFDYDRVKHSSGVCSTRRGKGRMLPRWTDTVWLNSNASRRRLTIFSALDID